MSSRLTVVLVMAVTALLGGCKSELYSGLQEREANEMVSVLSAERIVAARTGTKDGEYAISVENSDIPEATQVLSARGLPRTKFESLGKVFQGGGMVASPLEERARFMYALNQELSQSISQIAGVSSARVHVILPETSPLDSKPDRPRASVFIYCNPSVDLAASVPTIKTLIVNAVNGLAYEDVAVALFPAAAPSGAGGATMPSGLGDNVLWIVLALIGVAGAVVLGGRRPATTQARQKAPIRS